MCTAFFFFLGLPFVITLTDLLFYQHRCSQFADRYVEYEFVVIFIDMVLHKPQVYRHLLFNRINYFDSGFDVRRIFLLWLCVCVLNPLHRNRGHSRSCKGSGWCLTQGLDG